MRVVVREPGGAIGSVDRRFEVAALDGVDVAASDLVIGPATGGLPVRATVAADEGLGGLIEVYARRASDLEHIEVIAELARIGEDSVVTSIRADLLDVKTLAGGASRGARIALPVRDVPPGDYVVRAKVRASGETVTELARDVRIVPAGTHTAPAPVARQRGSSRDLLANAVSQELIAGLAATPTEPAVANAVTSAAAGDWAKAERELRAAPAGYVAGVVRGLALFADDRYPEAAKALSAALSARPAGGESAADKRVLGRTWFLLGWVHTYGGADLEAISAWRMSTQVDPTLVSGYLALADAYLGRSQRALAIAVLRAGLANVPSSIELANKLRDVERQGG